METQAQFGTVLRTLRGEKRRDIFMIVAFAVAAVLGLGALNTAVNAALAPTASVSSPAVAPAAKVAPGEVAIIFNPRPPKVPVKHPLGGNTSRPT